MRTIFRARAVGGITPIEAARREAVVLASVEHAEAGFSKLPPPMPQFGGRSPERDDEWSTLREAAPVEHVSTEAATPWHEEHHEPPVVRVELHGMAGAGKSSVAHVLRASLSHHGLAFDGPAELPSINLRQAIRDLIRRGIRIEITETETAPAQGGN